MTTKIREYKGLSQIKIAYVTLAFLSPVWFLLPLFPNFDITWSVLEGSYLTIFHFIVLLVAAYFHQDVYVDDQGLFVEFLWNKIKVPWQDIIEVKYIWGVGFLREEKRPLVVVVKSLTSFHRVFGVLYAKSIRPAFIIDVTIDDFQTLKKTIQKHIIPSRWKLL
ncbi:MAG TPA: hypothetical protein VFC02_13110 [Anaerolineales bacterium]|nr:hypothetical protein [Anaerolineales bacterium]